MKEIDVTSPNPNPTPEPNPNPTPPAPTFTPEQEKDINGRIASARRQAEADAKAKFEKDATDRAEQEQTERERKAQEERGEFDKVRTGIESERDTFKAERDDFKTKYEKALETITPGVTAQWKDLPPEVTKMYRGAEDDVLAKHAFIADTADLVKTLTATKSTTQRVPLTPNPADPTSGPSIEQTRKELAAARGVRR